MPRQVFLQAPLNWFLRKPESPGYGAPIARLSNKFNLRCKKEPAVAGALSYGFLIYAVNKQRAARGFGKGMEIRGSGEVEARCNIKRVSSSRTSSRDSLDETLTTRQDEDCPGKSLKQNCNDGNDDDKGLPAFRNCPLKIAGAGLAQME